MKPFPKRIDTHPWLIIGEVIGGIVLAGMVFHFLFISWRKWPDPLIDFGRELYLPWRLSEVAVLFRDIDIYYGPLSPYFNSFLFRLFGPGMMVLAFANLIICIAVIILFYTLFRRAWGRLPAFISTAIFICVFCFSQFTSIGNYNYITPYAHETTHGVLVCLLLIVFLLRWLRKASFRCSIEIGLLIGLAALLKAEILLAALLSCIAAIALRWRHQGAPGLPVFAGIAAGAVLPSILFFCYFVQLMPPFEAFEATTRAWQSLTTSRFTGEVIQSYFLGFDQPWLHYKEHVQATFIALVFFTGMCCIAWVTDRLKSGLLYFGIGTFMVINFVLVAKYNVIWMQTGRCLLGLSVIYIVIKILGFLRAKWPDEHYTMQSARFLIAVLALALLARMLLNGRIYHYGFYQAALAAMMVPAILIGELPSWFKFKKGAAIIISCTIALIMPGVLSLASYSQAVYSAKTISISQGADRFYAFPPQMNHEGYVINLLVEKLRQKPNGQTLLVLPEGVMINYLSRKRSTTSPVFYFSAGISGGREKLIVQELEQRPPSSVVLISRDLKKFGIQRYGERPGAGQLLLQWLTKNYEVEQRIGADPLIKGPFGASIYRPKSLPHDLLRK